MSDEEIHSPIPDQRPSEVRPGLHVDEPQAIDQQDPGLSHNIAYDDLIGLLQAARRIKRVARRYRRDPAWQPIEGRLMDWKASLKGETSAAAYFLQEIDRVL